MANGSSLKMIRTLANDLPHNKAAIVESQPLHPGGHVGQVTIARLTMAS